jgi:hypothetical protein
LVWSTRSKIAIETVATIAAINAGFRNARSIPVNASAGPEFRLDHAARSGHLTGCQLTRYTRAIPLLPEGGIVRRWTTRTSV